MDINEYNLEVFKFIRLEINLRIEYHFKMLMWKIGLVAGLLAFLIENGQSISISPFFIAAIFLLLMDIIILENLRHIRSAGSFIKNNIENYEGEYPALRWESDFAQYNNNWRCWSSKGYIFGIWSIAPLLAMVGFVTNFDPLNKSHIAILLLCAYLCAYTLFLISKTFSTERPDFAKASSSPIRHNKANPADAKSRAAD